MASELAAENLVVQRAGIDGGWLVSRSRFACEENEHERQKPDAIHYSAS